MASITTNKNLQNHIEVLKPKMHLPAQSGSFLTDLQKVIVGKQLVQLTYFSNNQNELTQREVEPIGLFYYSAAWHLIAWCRLRNGFRDFRCDRIKELKPTNGTFEPRSISTMQEYFNSLQQANEEMRSASVLFNIKEARYIQNSRHYFGFVSVEEVEGQLRMKFLTGELTMLARWLLSYGRGVEIESPDELKLIVQGLVEELVEHYIKSISA